MDPLSVEINLLSPKDVPEDVLARLEDEGNDPLRMNGYFWIRSGSRVLSWKDDEAGETVFQTVAMRNGTAAGLDDPWLMILSGKVPTACVPDIKDGVPRCVVLFEAVPDQGKLLEEYVMTEIAPVERGDVVRETSIGKIALIKTCRNHTEDEIREYTAAVIETVETETGIPVQAGIGRTAYTLAGMKDSFSQAEKALEIGRRFRLNGPVFEYGQQIMERLISAVPADERSRMRHEVFTPESEKMMTDEMMETVRAFFQNDLNLSTAARQLFIHRNTLIYRLDKIRKTTGFDLRRFQDAAAFRLLCRLPADEDHD